ncbi:MAG: metallophosphoesterase [Methylococcaceae bacterium]|nr:metallophosphoesterase [Methylococcaceae bacterium]
MNKNQILFAGDPHGCFNNIVSAVFKHRPAAVVMLGDYNLESPLEQYLQAIIGETDIYWIPGNHDFDSRAEYEYLFNSALSNNNLHLKVVEVEGIRIAGLGGIFASRIWNPSEPPRWKDKQHWLKSQPHPIKKIPLHKDNAIWHHEFEHMKRTLRADILVSHEAPSCHQYGFQVIDELAEALGVSKIFHGHHHRHYNDVLANRITVTGASLEGVVNLAGESVL